MAKRAAPYPNEIAASAASWNPCAASVKARSSFSLAVRYPFAGVVWQLLHHLVGFRQLGCDVYYLEDNRAYVYDPLTQTPVADAQRNLALVGPVLDRFGFRGKWAFLDPVSEEYFGMTKSQCAALLSETEAVINRCGASNRLYPALLDAILIVQPETVIRWHRHGFRAYWRWRFRHVGGRPRIDSEMRALIRGMNRENPLWGAPRIHGELLMLGIDVAESTVSRYLVRRRRPPSQGWKTFLRNQRWASLRWISSSCARSRSSCSMAYSVATAFMAHSPRSNKRGIVYRTRYKRHLSDTPLSLCTPRSSKAISASVTRALTALETSTSFAPALAITRAPI